MSVSKILPPGSTIGILGSGQLGRMTAMAAARLGYRCIVYAPDFAALEPLAATGAEFIALGEAVFNHPEGPAEAVRQAMAIIKAVKAP